MASQALVRGSRMVYQGNEVSVQWVGVSLATVADEQEKSFTVPISRLKPIKISREENFRRAMAKNPTCPAPILEKFFLVEGAPEGWDIRLHSALFHDVIEAWQSAGLVVLPENHRAIAAGARGGAPMWGIAATLESKRGISDDLLCALVASGLTVADNKVNDLNLVRWLLQAGQPYGWRVTRTV